MNYSREDACRAWLTYGMFRADLLIALLEEYGTAEAVYDRFCASGSEFLKKYCINKNNTNSDELAKNIFTFTVFVSSIVYIYISYKKYQRLKYSYQTPRCFLYTVFHFLFYFHLHIRNGRYYVCKMQKLFFGQKIFVFKLWIFAEKI